MAANQQTIPLMQLALIKKKSTNQESKNNNQKCDEKFQEKY